MGRRPFDLTGQRFGAPTVIRRVPDHQKKKVLWECKCDCGNTCVRNAFLLTHDINISCGCVKRGKSGPYTPKPSNIARCAGSRISSAGRSRDTAKTVPKKRCSKIRASTNASGTKTITRTKQTAKRKTAASERIGSLSAIALSAGNHLCRPMPARKYAAKNAARFAKRKRKKGGQT